MQLALRTYGQTQGHSNLPVLLVRAKPIPFALPFTIPSQTHWEALYDELANPTSLFEKFIELCLLEAVHIRFSESEAPGVWIGFFEQYGRCENRGNRGRRHRRHVR